MQPPSAYTWSQENKVLACFSVFFLGNTVESSLVQTGAFEVELNGMPIWSKLKSGRIPQGDELFDIINNQLRLSKSKFPNPVQDKSFESFEKSEEDEISSETEERNQESSHEHNEFEEFDNAEKEEL